MVTGLAISFFVLSFVPYVAIPLGNSTNISFAAVIATILIVRLIRRPMFLVLIILLCICPLLATLLRLLFQSSQVNVNAYFTSFFIILTFFGAASATDVLRERSVAVISFCISASAIIAILQKYLYLDKGVVPWIEIYNVPGYASVAQNAQTIALYIKRPFGLFPEPSFLAGTLALAASGMLVLMAHYRLQPRASIILSLVLATFTIFISDSGSGVICIAILAMAILIPYVRRYRIVILLMPVALATAIWLGLSIAASRQDGMNTSWNDRFASIIGGARLWTSDPLTFLLGVGRGMVPTRFGEDDFAFAGMTVYSNIPDIYSVLGRIVLENGILFGLPFIIWMAVLILRLGGQRAILIGVLFTVLWAVVAGLTISYETAAWIWILPGICLAFSLSNRSIDTRRSDVRFEDPSRSQ
ncbi:hypothetical protein [Arthrobacter humicola]